MGWVTLGSETCPSPIKWPTWTKVPDLILALRAGICWVLGIFVSSVLHHCILQLHITSLHRYLSPVLHHCMTRTSWVPVYLHCIQAENCGLASCHLGKQSGSQKSSYNYHACIKKTWSLTLVHENQDLTGYFAMPQNHRAHGMYCPCHKVSEFIKCGGCMELCKIQMQAERGSYILNTLASFYYLHFPPQQSCLCIIFFPPHNLAKR